MKILVFSDSHKNCALMYEVLHLLDKKIDMVLFLGDCVEDIEDYAYVCEDKDVYYVSGNCDFKPFEPEELIVNADGKKIFMTHGHRYGVKSGRNRIVDEAIKKGADICLYGHSHSPDIYEQNGIFFMNPGSITLPRGISDNPTYGIIDIENGEISGKIIEAGMKKFKEFKF